MRPPAAEAAPAADTLRKAALVVVSLDEALARQLVSRLDRSDVDALNLELTRLATVDPAEQEAALAEFAAAARGRMRFVFDDVSRLDDASIRGAYREDDALTWALALAGGSRGTRTRVLEALEPRAAQSLSRMLAGLGPFRLDEVEAAQSELAARLRAAYESDTTSARAQQ
jgi:flagellar motor switch protein FliG